MYHDNKCPITSLNDSELEFLNKKYRNNKFQVVCYCLFANKRAHMIDTFKLSLHIILCDVYACALHMPPAQTRSGIHILRKNNSGCLLGNSPDTYISFVN